MSGAKARQTKSWKKLGPFYDIKKDAPKRVKAVKEFEECAPDDEKVAFYSSEASQFFSLFLGAVDGYVGSLEKKGKADGKELTGLVSVLKSLMQFSPESVQKGTVDNMKLGDLVKRFLAKENKLTLRREGFGLLLMLLTLTSVSSHASLLPSACLLGSFDQDFKGTVQRGEGWDLPIMAGANTVLLPADKSKETQTDLEMAKEMTRSLFQHVTKADNFSFWWTLLKKHIFPYVYPEVFKETGLAPGMLGFRPHAPSAFQEVFIPELAQWLASPAKVSILFATKEDVAILFAFLVHAVSVADVIEASRVMIDAYRTLLWPKAGSVAPVLAPALLEHRLRFVTICGRLFSLTATGPHVAKHEALCLDVLRMLQTIVAEPRATPPEDVTTTAEMVLTQMIDMVSGLVSQGHLNAALQHKLAGDAISAVLQTWVLSETTNAAMWELLHATYAGWFHRMEAVVEGRRVLIIMSDIVKELLYPPARAKKKIAVEQALEDAADAEAAASPPAATPAAPVPEKAAPQTAPPPQGGSVIVGQAGGGGGQAEIELRKIKWTTENVYYVWYNVFDIFLRCNVIADAAIHCAALRAITDSMEVFMNAELAAEWAQLYDPTRHPPLQLVDVFGPLLFEACRLADDFAAGKVVAYTALCRMIVVFKRPSLPLSFTSHFFSLLREGLYNFEHPKVVFAILKQSPDIFSVGLAGVTVLVPVYLAAIQQFMTQKQTAGGAAAPLDVRLAAVRVVCSLVCYPRAYEGLVLPMEGASPLSSSDLKGHVAQLLQAMLQAETNGELLSLVLCGMCVMILEEFNFTVPDMALIGTLFDCIAERMVYKESEDVVRVASGSMSNLAVMIPRLLELDAQFVHRHVQRMCQYLLELVRPGMQDSIVCKLYQTLYDWLINSPPSLFDVSETCRCVFEALALGLFGEQVSAAQPTPAGIAAYWALYRRISSKPAHNSEAVREEAENTLYKLINYHGIFPSVVGPSMMGSAVAETDDVTDEAAQSVLLFSLNQFSAVSMLEVPTAQGPVARVIVRDPTGRFVWDSSPLWLPLQGRAAADPLVLARENSAAKAAAPQPKTRVAQNREVREVPAHVAGKDGKDGKDEDILLQVLSYLSTMHKDCLSETGQRRDEPMQPFDPYAVHFDEMRRKMEEQRLADAAGVGNRPLAFALCTPEAEPATPSAIPNHMVRMFLSHIGFLDMGDYGETPSVQFLEYSEKSRRTIAQLDKSGGRELLKIGVIYVKEGQENQRVILRNDASSREPQFLEFLRALGWNVKLAQHLGYVGGLDKGNLSTGETTPFYADHLVELVLHDVTAMPTVPTDDQQILKKRHVGNDIVHIVYTEHSRDYAPSTITSQFNDAHIVVYPLPNGLFRVQVFRKEKVSVFGPLVDGMAVNKQLLGLLVRFTAINANRTVRYQTAGYKSSFATRKYYLTELTSKYRVKKEPENFLSESVFKRHNQSTSGPSLPASGGK